MEQLPENVLLRILTKLHAFDVIRAALSSPFLRAVATSAAHLIPRSSVMSILMKDSNAGLVFCAHDPSRNACLFFPLDFLSMLASSFRSHFLTPLSRVQHGILATSDGGISRVQHEILTTSDGGIVCMDSQSVNRKSESDECWREKAFLVFNPITGSKRLIPYPHATLDPEAVGIQYDTVSDRYELFALIECGSRRHVMVRYASLTSTWRRMEAFSVAEGFELDSRTIVCCNSVLFTLWKGRNAFKLYSVDGCAVNVVELPQTEQLIYISVFLMAVGGTLHIVMADHDCFLREVWVWKLQDDRKWSLVSRMPGHLKPPPEHFGMVRIVECMGINSMLYIDYIRFHKQQRVLLYDISKDEWSWIDEDKACLPFSVRFLPASTVIFEPSLTAVA
ncbi:hypothetical protein KP509_01G065600 [Ceratopteris richardii]|uniref:F-box domain-containing protein n=1 Tax=Ceratopteris richardii TaxID=49495 RepID=A0A8T2VM23_CERRI|nr:hypothetical protein KP509_01G065600 [Ceratopteris richardii]